MSRRGGWFSARLLRALLGRLHRGWEALPREARRAWWLSLGIGLLLVEALVLALVAAARALEEAGALAWEAEALRRIDAQPYLSFNLGLWLEGPANGFVLWLLVLYASAVAAWRRRPLVALTLLTGYTLMYLPILTGWMAWDRPRPSLIEAGVASPGGFFRSFPSGHTVQAVFAHGYLAFLWLRRAARPAERAFILLLLSAVLVAVVAGRLRLGAHWPSDAVGGLAIGGAWLAAAVAAQRRAERAAGGPHPAA